MTDEERLDEAEAEIKNLNRTIRVVQRFIRIMLVEKAISSGTPDSFLEVLMEQVENELVVSYGERARASFNADLAGESEELFDLLKRDWLMDLLKQTPTVGEA